MKILFSKTSGPLSTNLVLFLIIITFFGKRKFVKMKGHTILQGGVITVRLFKNTLENFTKITLQGTFVQVSDVAHRPPVLEFFFLTISGIPFIFRNNVYAH